MLNNRMTNEFKFGHVRESLLQGPAALFDDDWKFIGFHGVEPFDVGSQNTHPDYIAGPRNTYAQDLIRDVNFDDTLTWIKSGWGGEHTFKVGGGVQPQRARCRRARRPISSACSRSRPTRRSTPATRAPIPIASASAWVSSTSTQIDHRASGYMRTSGRSTTG